jgi:hypothetical protein
MTIKEMLNATGWTVRKFAEYFEIPQRTVENWIYRANSCPAYLLKLMEYRLRKENCMKQYVVRDREAGNIIEYVSTYEEGADLIAEYEAEDKRDGSYTDDFYEVCQI